jgi:site-specific DNA-cytosine methylase
VEFIRQHFHPEVVFPDLKSLDESMAENDQRVLSLIERVHWWICGIECDSASRLNSSGGEAVDCILMGAGKTGSSAVACMKFIKRHKPPFFLLENFKSLNAKNANGKTNLETLVSLGNESGYLMKAKLVQANEWGAPQNRERHYIMGACVSTCPIDQFSESFKAPAWFAEIDGMQTPRPATRNA